MENLPQKIGLGGKGLALRAAGGLAVIGTLGFGLPLIANALFASFALAGVGLVILGGVIVNMFIPGIMQRAENAALEVRKLEAVRRPIEQMQNDMIRAKEIAGIKEKELAAFRAMIDENKANHEESVNKYPGRDWSNSERAIQDLEEKYNFQEQDLAELQESIESSKDDIGFFEQQLKMALSLERAQSASGSSRDEAINEILVKIAKSSVSERLNKAMATMTVASNLKKRREEIRDEKERKLAVPAKGEIV